MLRIIWRDEFVSVRRLVLNPAGWPASALPVKQLARRAGLLIADESAVPAPGDFWLGCVPVAGWGEYLDSVAWASFVDAPLVLAEIRDAVISDLLVAAEKGSTVSTPITEPANPVCAQLNHNTL